MTPPPAPPRAPSAGGALIALGAVAGAGVGFIERQATLWFIAGTTLGVAAALLVWWRGRRR